MQLRYIYIKMHQLMSFSAEKLSMHHHRVHCMNRQPMIFTIIVILIIALVIVAIIINAVQQHKQEEEANKRRELAKVKSVIDETENILMAASQLPVPMHMLAILNGRILSALTIMGKLNPKAFDINQRIEDAKSKSHVPEAAVPTSPPSFNLPDNDKIIIQYIQSIKRLRVLLRAEHTKGRVAPHVFAGLDTYFERLQLKVNVDTLAKRGQAAIQSNMLGSARQYFEKAIKALEAQNNQDEYCTKQAIVYREKLTEIQHILLSEQQPAAGENEESDSLAQQFDTKNKW